MTIPCPTGLGPDLPPGALSLFSGSPSIHRVTEVGPTSQPRIMAIFSYDERPDQVFSQGYIDLARSFSQDAAAHPWEYPARAGGRLKDAFGGKSKAR